MNLERLGSITSELSSNLIKSIVVPPGGLLGWFTRHRADRARERQRLSRPDLRGDDSLDIALAEYPAGPVVLLGGSPYPDEAIVEAIHLAGGRSARVAVIPVAAIVDPAASAAEAMRLFTRFGMKKVELFSLDSREKAASQEWCTRLAEFDAVVLCGESPAQGLQVLQATLAAVTLRDMVAAGKLLVGIDAGAAILGSRAFSSSEVSEATAGLGVLPALIVDTEFTQCSRFGRLAKALGVEGASLMLGAGLDAGAALVVVSGEARVLGESSVTFLDPRERDGGTNALKVHLLTDGYRMNLRLRRPVAPQKAASLSR
ncbi:MAG: cyanophycinase [Bacillota bacterium]